MREKIKDFLRNLNDGKAKAAKQDLLSIVDAKVIDRRETVALDISLLKK